MGNHIKEVIRFWVAHYEAGYSGSVIIALWLVSWSFILLALAVGLFLGEVGLSSFGIICYVAAAFPLLCKKAAIWAQEDDIDG